MANKVNNQNPQGWEDNPQKGKKKGQAEGMPPENDDMTGTGDTGVAGGMDEDIRPLDDLDTY